MKSAALAVCLLIYIVVISLLVCLFGCVNIYQRNCTGMFLILIFQVDWVHVLLNGKIAKIIIYYQEQVNGGSTSCIEDNRVFVYLQTSVPKIMKTK